MWVRICTLAFGTPNGVGGCCPRDSWVARDIILPYSLTYMRLMIEAVAFKAGRR